MRSVKKQAAKDAAEYARAKMFYGEGAGTRRKLIKETVEYKMRVVPGYHTAYTEAINAQDMAKHASKAHSERMRKNVAKNVGRNTRGIVKGNRKSLSTGVALAVVVGSWAHETGADKQALEFSKKKVRQVRDKIEVIKFRRQVDKVHNITTVK